MQQSMTLEHVQELIKQGETSQVAQEIERMKAQSPVNRDGLLTILRMSLAHSQIGLATDLATFLLATNPDGIVEQIAMLDLKSRAQPYYDRMVAMVALTKLAGSRIMDADALLQMAKVAERLCMVKLALSILKRARRCGASEAVVATRMVEVHAFNRKLREERPFKGSEKLAIWRPRFLVRRLLQQALGVSQSQAVDYVRLATLAETLGFPDMALAFAGKHNEAVGSLSARVFYWLRLSRAGRTAEAFDALEQDMPGVLQRGHDYSMMREAAEIALHAGRSDVEVSLLSRLADQYPQNASLRDALAAARWTTGQNAPAPGPMPLRYG